MGLIEILLIVLIIAVLFGAFGVGGGAYAWPGGILGLILVIVLIWLLVSGGNGT